MYTHCDATTLDSLEPSDFWRKVGAQPLSAKCGALWALAPTQCPKCLELSRPEVFNVRNCPVLEI